jgi:hypothetical protein
MPTLKTFTDWVYLTNADDLLYTLMVMRYNVSPENIVY